MEEVVSLLNELKDLAQFIIPIFIFSLVTYFLICIRFVFWFIDFNNQKEEDLYKRLKAKYENDNEVH